MPFVERTLRAMTHLNIGATLATAVWILWSGLNIVALPSPPPSATPRANPGGGAPAKHLPRAPQPPADSGETERAA